MDSNNLCQQAEEIEALSSIYGTDWKQVQQEDNSSYSFKINQDVTLFVHFHPEYPSCAPPKYQLLAPTLNTGQKESIISALQDIYIENIGTPIIFQWIEKLKEIVLSNDKILETSVKNVESKQEEHSESVKNTESDLNIIHGSVILDQKSTFQGHASSLTTQEDITKVMESLLKNRKISQATHNILAYRLKLSGGGMLQDYDDDGETHAGSRLLHLLQVLDISDVAVVVSRWYGGVHLGPDRFRHINNAARQVLQQGGFI